MEGGVDIDEALRLGMDFLALQQVSITYSSRIELGIRTLELL